MSVEVKPFVVVAGADEKEVSRHKTEKAAKEKIRTLRKKNAEESYGIADASLYDAIKPELHPSADPHEVIEPEIGSYGPETEPGSGRIADMNTFNERLDLLRRGEISNAQSKAIEEGSLSVADALDANKPKIEASVPTPKVRKAKANGAKKVESKEVKEKAKTEPLPKPEGELKRRDDVAAAEAGIYPVNDSYVVKVDRDGDREAYTAYSVLVEGSTPVDGDISHEERSYRPVAKQRSAFRVIRSIFQDQTARPIRGGTHEIDLSGNVIVVTPKEAKEAKPKKEKAGATA